VFSGGLFGRDCKDSGGLGILFRTLIAKLSAGSARVNSSFQWIPFSGFLSVDSFKLIARSAGWGAASVFHCFLQCGRIHQLGC
jgi:hypothetical protein